MWDDEMNRERDSRDARGYDVPKDMGFRLSAEQDRLDQDHGYGSDCGPLQGNGRQGQFAVLEIDLPRDSTFGYDQIDPPQQFRIASQNLSGPIMQRNKKRTQCDNGGHAQ